MIPKRVKEVNICNNVVSFHFDGDKVTIELNILQG